MIAGFDRPNIRYHVRHREQTGKQLRELLAAQPGPAIVYAPSRDKAEKIAEALGRGGPAVAALSCRPGAAGACPQPGGVRQLRGDGDRRHGRVRNGHRQARRADRRPRRDPQKHRGLLPGDRPRRTRRRAGRGVAVLGGAGFRPRPPAHRAGSRARAPRRRARAAQRAGGAGRDAGMPPRDLASPFRRGSAGSAAAIATIASIRRRRSTLPRSRANCCRRRSAPKCASGSGISPRCSAGNDSEKVRSFGHHRLSVFGIADADELALVRPVARALIARDALRADAYGGLSFGPGAGRS